MCCTASLCLVQLPCLALILLTRCAACPRVAAASLCINVHCTLALQHDSPL